MSQNLTAILDQFVADFVAAGATVPQALTTEYDPQWPSPCYQQPQQAGESCAWRPVLRDDNASLEDLGAGLDMPLHPDLSAFYCRYWSDNLSCRTDRGGLALLQPWNDEDFVRLQQNLVAHVLMKRRLGQRETLFVAATDDDDFIVSMLNSTGEIVLEQVGLEPAEVLASDLATFITTLSPDFSD